MKKTNDFLSDAKISSLKIDFVCQFFLTMRPSKKKMIFGVQIGYFPLHS